MRIKPIVLAALTSVATVLAPLHAFAWQPNKTIEFVVPAGTGGGADQMARFIAKISNEKQLLPQKIVVVNKGLGAGAEGFLSMKMSRGDAHKLVITLSNVFTAPLSTGVPFNWKDLTPVIMLSQDQFVLWVAGDSPYKNAKDFMVAAKGGNLRFAGTGSAQEDEILSVSIAQKAGAKFRYMPFAGGGAVANSVANRSADVSVNNPIEAVGLWKSGKVRPLCVFDDKIMPGTAKVTVDRSWADIPTCKAEGLDVTYQMMRGIFMAPGVSNDQVEFYDSFFRRVMATPEWKAFMEEGSFKTTVLAGADYRAWVATEDARHKELMKTANLIAK